MTFRSITFKLMFFLVIIGIIFTGLSNYFNNQILFEAFSKELHSKNRQILSGLTDEFDGALQEVEGTVNTFAMLTEERFSEEGLFVVPDMGQEELFYEEIFRRYLASEEAVSTSLYIYFDPDLDGEAHDVWLHRRGDAITREEEIPLERYQAKENMSWFYGPMESGLKAWINPYTNRFDEYVTSYVAPIYVEGTFIGILGMYLELEILITELENRSYYEGDVFWVLDREMGVIFHPDYISGTPMTEIIRWDETDDQGLSIIGGKSYQTYQIVTDEGWTFNYSVPEEVLENVLWAARIRVLVIFLTVTLILLLSLWTIIRNYRKRVDRILEALHEIGEGNLRHRIQVDAEDEIGIMAAAINSSNESLIQTIEANEDLAFNNQVTGLPNRQRLVSIMEKRVADSDDGFGLIYMDLDDFSTINDLLGYSSGDAFIREIGARIQACAVEGMTLYHTSIDEFVFVSDSQWKRGKLYEFAMKILGEFGRNITFQEHHLFVSMSIGIVMRTEGMEHLEDIFRAADMALEESRSYGTNNVAFYELGMYQALVARKEMERDFARALKEDQFVVHYQPKVSVAERKVVGMEALVRWEHPEKGMIYPLDFIGFAESSGLINELGDLVLAKVCRQLSHWAEAGEKTLSVSVNISVRQLRDRHFNERIQNIVAETGVDPEQIEFEITESMFMEDNGKYLSKVLSLKAAGFTIALDDFGSGYSSLKSINDLPIDVLKVDKSLVQVSELSQKMGVLLRTIVEMSHELNYQVVAEGVETRTQLAVFENLGCDLIQGYYYSKPLSPEAFIAYVRERESSMDDL